MLLNQQVRFGHAEYTIEFRQGRLYFDGERVGAIADVDRRQIVVQEDLSQWETVYALCRVFEFIMLHHLPSPIPIISIPAD